MRTSVIVIAAGLLICLQGSLCVSQTTKPASTQPVSSLALTEFIIDLNGPNCKKLGPKRTIPDDVKSLASRKTKYSEHLSYVVTNNDKQAVYVDGRLLGEYDQLAGVVEVSDILVSSKGPAVLEMGLTGGNERRFWSTDAFSIRNRFKKKYVGQIYTIDENGRVAFLAKKDSKWMAFLDGQPGPEVDKVDDLEFSPKKNMFWYIGIKDSVCTMYVEGKAGPEFKVVYPPAFSRNEKRMAYQAHDGKKCYMVVDGIKGEPYDAIGSINFSWDESHYAYAAQKGDKWIVVCNGKEGQVYDDIYQTSVTFSTSRLPKGPDYCGPALGADGKPLLYVARKGKKSILVQDDTDIGEYEFVNFLNYNLDNHRFAICHSHVRNRILRIDGKDSDEYESIYEFTFSPDGKRYAFAGRKNDITQAVIDGKVDSFNGSINWLQFSNDSNNIFYVIYNNGQDLFINNGKEVFRSERMFRPVLSPNGKKFACVLRRNNHNYVVCDNLTGPEFDDRLTIIHFSPDDRHFWYTAVRGNKYYIVVDDKISQAFDYMSPRSYDVMECPAAIEVEVHQKGEVYLVTIPFEK
ncbi:MAG: PD40 domain-containing protein [Planctomycetes bacterium]|nr:PD40 domain-containing protein [Planctomycetota bacterium]